MLKIIAIASTEWLVAWFADWGLQNSWQANNKRQNWAIAVIMLLFTALHFCSFTCGIPTTHLRQAILLNGF
jgi:hypothetical protein